MPRLSGTFAPVFPTPVGMNRNAAIIRYFRAGVPHARGDEPNFSERPDAVNRCSPRPWG